MNEVSTNIQPSTTSNTNTNTTNVYDTNLGEEQHKVEPTAPHWIEALTIPIVQQIEEKARQAATEAAEGIQATKSKETPLVGEPAYSAVNQLQEGAKHTTDTAVAEGKHDVEEAKATLAQSGAQLAAQAKELVTSAITTAQSYCLGSTTTGEQQPVKEGSQSDIVSSITSGATVAADTTKQYLASAQKIAEPHIEQAKSAAQKYLGTQESQEAPVAETQPAVTPFVVGGSGTKGTPIYLDD